MSKMVESCSVCARSFDVQFRYQMEESKGGFLFFCSHQCQGKHVRGEATGGVTCDGCAKHFTVELASQVLRTKEGRSYACSEGCRQQLLREAAGERLVDSLSRAATPSAPPAAPRPFSAPVVAAPPSGRTSAELPPTVPPPRVAAQAAQVASAALGGAAAFGVSTSRASISAPPPSSDSAPRSAYRGPKRLAIFNHKGGTGKTTTTVSLAGGLAERGLKVLVVDTDSQGNVGVSLNVKAEKSLYHTLVMGIRPEDVAQNVRPNFDLIASNETLAAAELYLAGRQNRDRVLRDRLSAFSDQYDVVLLDCSPSLSLMNQNALVMADALLVPVACDFLSLVGVRQVLRTVKNINSLLHHPVQIFGVLPTFYDARARICRDAIDTLVEHFGERCLPPIRSATKAKEAPAQGRTIFEYAPESNAAEDYLRIIDRLMAGHAAAGGSGADLVRQSA